jgi:predicted PurR-regulated permease PerM
VAVLLVACWFVRKGLLLIYVSMIFAVVFSPAVEWIQSRRINLFSRTWSPGRGVALLILVGVMALAVSVFAFFAVPPIISDSQSLTTQIPSNMQELANKVRQLPFGNRIASHLNGSGLRHIAESLASTGLKVFQGLAGAVSGLFTIALLTAYFILDGKRSFQWGLSFIPRERRERARATSIHARDRVQKWLAGQVLLMLILGISSTIVFGALGVRYFYALGLFAGLANFVPVLGPIATLVVAGLVAALDSWMKVVGVVIFYFVYQQVENAYLTPHIMRTKVGLPGVAVIAALVIGSEIAGVLGAIVAVPSAALVATFVNEYLQEDEQGTAHGRKAA